MASETVPVKTYVYVLIALLALTGLTCGVSYVDMGRWNAAVAVLIAVAKGTLVALFFMHLKYSRRLMQVVFAGGLFWLGIMLALTLSDFLTRDWKPDRNSHFVDGAGSFERRGK